MCCCSVSTSHSTETSALKKCWNATYFRCLTCPSAYELSVQGDITKLLGADPGKLQKMSCNPEAQCPDTTVVEELHNSFKRWEQQPGVCGSNNPESVALWQFAWLQLRARLAHLGHLDIRSCFPVVRKLCLPCRCRETEITFSRGLQTASISPCDSCCCHGGQPGASTWHTSPVGSFLLENTRWSPRL